MLKSCQNNVLSGELKILMFSFQFAWKNVLDAEETITTISAKMKSTIITIINCILMLVNPFYACI